MPKTLKIQEKEKEEPVKPANVPFAQNRFQGQFESITKDLFKKAQEVIKTEKQNEEK